MVQGWVHEIYALDCEAPQEWEGSKPPQ